MGCRSSGPGRSRWKNSLASAKPAASPPTPGLTLDLKRAAVGVYQLRLSSADLPRLYDYAGKTYRPFAGPLRIRIAAKSGRLATARLVDVTVTK